MSNQYNNKQKSLKSNDTRKKSNKRVNQNKEINKLVSAELQKMDSKRESRKRNQVQVYFRTSLKDASQIAKQLKCLGLHEQKGISFMHDQDDLVCVSQAQEHTRQLENLRAVEVRRNQLVDDELHDLYSLHPSTGPTYPSQLPTEHPEDSQPTPKFNLYNDRKEEQHPSRQKLEDFIIKKESHDDNQFNTISSKLTQSLHDIHSGTTLSHDQALTQPYPNSTSTRQTYPTHQLPELADPELSQLFSTQSTHVHSQHLSQMNSNLSSSSQGVYPEPLQTFDSNNYKSASSGLIYNNSNEGQKEFSPMKETSDTHSPNQFGGFEQDATPKRNGPSSETPVEHQDMVTPIHENRNILNTSNPTHLQSVSSANQLSKGRRDPQEGSQFSSGERPGSKDWTKDPLWSPQAESQGKGHSAQIQQNKTHPSQTTLMVRNIPNRLTQNILLNQIDEGFLGCYDFFYMPIDKESQANYGYAFINMTHTRFVEEFRNKFHEQKWPHACSAKICNINQARIQGYEKLCVSFQNEKKFSEKLPKPHIQARCMQEIYYKELPMTPETQWRAQKTVSDPSRAQFLPVAKVLQKRYATAEKGFDQMWPKIFNMIKDKLVKSCPISNQDQDNIDQNYFKKICREIYAKTKKEWESRQGSLQSETQTPSHLPDPTTTPLPGAQNSLATPKPSFTVSSLKSSQQPVYSPGVQEQRSPVRSGQAMPGLNLFQAEGDESGWLQQQLQADLAASSNESVKMEEVMQSTQQPLFHEQNDQNLQIIPNLDKPPGLQLTC